MATNYQAGVRLEARCAHLLRDHGVFVVRAAGSHGVADLVGVHARHRPLLVQCKTTGRLGHESWNVLYDLAGQHACIPMVATWTPTHRAVLWIALTGHHLRGSHDWPGQPWTPADWDNPALVEA